MTAIVERLRLVPDKNGLMYDDYDDVMEAADTIEALQAEVARLLGDMVAIDRCSRRNLHAGRKIDAIVSIAERALSRQALKGTDNAE